MYIIFLLFLEKSYNNKNLSFQIMISYKNNYINIKKYMYNDLKIT